MDLLLISYQDYCYELAAAHRSASYKPQYESWDDYIESMSLSKTRAKLIVNFVNFLGMCREQGLALPSTPEQVQPLLSLPKKRWVDVWALALTYTRIEDLTATGLKACMDHFGLRRSVPPKHIRDSRKVQRTAKTFVNDLPSGEDLVAEIGRRGLGKWWEPFVEKVIDADQAKMNDAE